jgi:hypothetical protein
VACKVRWPFGHNPFSKVADLEYSLLLAWRIDPDQIEDG